MGAQYDFSALEPRWQAFWAKQGCFRAANPGQPGAEKPKFYVLDFFPYPSGAGLHVGHPLGYIATDIIARVRRMQGYNVLHPMGWDAFGLPAEQYAVETGVHPAITTRKNIETYTRQLQMIGLAYDWDREVATCEPDYYHWTQWIFLKIYDSWYDPETRWTDRFGREVVGRARPISELPIPSEVRDQGEHAVAEYCDDHRLAYLAEVPVNWCPALGTVLANEEVTNEGRSERGNHPVFRRPMKQWMLRITEYADRLLADLEMLDWPEPIKLMQRNWIGRSEGAYVDFCIDDGSENVIRVYTTRPDTLFGATYMVLAPEHNLVPIVTAPERRAEVDAYIAAAKEKSELDRTADTKEKTGVFTGGYAINPVNHARVPIWIADYVLAGYGTGSIMAVPGSDKRDYDFAKKFNIPIVPVVGATDADHLAAELHLGPDEQPQIEGHKDASGADYYLSKTGAFCEPGVAVNSPSDAFGERFADQCNLNGLPTSEAKAKIIAWLEERDLGEGTTQYKLRDWLFSRQRYWGEPFPILHRDDGLVVGEDEENLPVALPEMEDFRPQASDDPDATPATPLSKATEWATVERDGRTYRRELNTMPQWAGSCWYYLRFCDAQNEQALIDPEVEQYWCAARDHNGQPKAGAVDLYVGGAEHAVLHLLYARFWHKVLYDLGVVSTPEPFHKLFNQGMIQSFSYTDARGVYVHCDDIDFEGEQAKHKQTGEVLTAAVEKMSKSKKNVVNPDQIIHEYGADTLRLYEMYMGPLESSKPWNTRDIIGVHRFLQRVWRLIVTPESEDDPSQWRLNPVISTDTRDEGLERALHKTIKKVTEDVDRFAYNTAIAELIKWINEAQKAPAVHRDQLERFLALLAPFAPHIAEELWQRLGHETTITAAAWPKYDEKLTVDAEVEIAVQIKGKVKGRVMVAADADEAAYLAAAKTVPAVQIALAGGEPKKVIVVPGRLVNLIV